MALNKVHRSYLFGLLGCGGVYLALTYGAKVTIKALGVEGLALDALALLPTIPFTGFFFVFARYLRDIDEYRRHRTVQALLISLAIGLSIISGWDFLQGFGDAAAPQPFVITTGFMLLFALVQGVRELLDRFERRA